MIYIHYIPVNYTHDILLIFGGYFVRYNRFNAADLPMSVGVTV